MLTARPSVVPTEVPNAKAIADEGERDVLCVICERSRMIRLCPLQLRKHEACQGLACCS